MSSANVIQIISTVFWILCWFACWYINRETRKLRKEARDLVTQNEGYVRQFISLLPTETLKKMAGVATGRFGMQIKAEIYNREHKN